MELAPARRRYCDDSLLFSKGSPLSGTAKMRPRPLTAPSSSRASPWSRSSAGTSDTTRGSNRVSGGPLSRCARCAGIRCGLAIVLDSRAAGWPAGAAPAFGAGGRVSSTGDLLVKARNQSAIEIAMLRRLPALTLSRRQTVAGRVVRGQVRDVGGGGLQPPTRASAWMPQGTPRPARSLGPVPRARVAPAPRAVTRWMLRQRGLRPGARRQRQCG